MTAIIAAGRLVAATTPALPIRNRRREVDERTGGVVGGSSRAASFLIDMVNLRGNNRVLARSNRKDGTYHRAGERVQRQVEADDSRVMDWLCSWGQSPIIVSKGFQIFDQRALVVVR